MKQAVALFKSTRITKHRVSGSVLDSRSVLWANVGYVWHMPGWYVFWHVCSYWFCVRSGMIQCGIYVYNIYCSFYVVIFSRDKLNISTSSTTGIWSMVAMDYKITVTHGMARFHGWGWVRVDTAGCSAFRWRWSNVLKHYIAKVRNIIWEYKWQ
jgi:hypothetical protein